MFNENEIQRFWAKILIDETDFACWNWQAGKVPFGYGMMWFGGKDQNSHRVAWQIAFGLIPKGMHVCHHCDNPSCCNPNHLFLGTPKQNMNDRDGKQRGPIGEKQGRSKLKPPDVLSIRSLYATGKCSQPALASQFSIDQAQVWRIIHRKTWKHI